MQSESVRSTILSRFLLSLACICVCIGLTGFSDAPLSVQIGIDIVDVPGRPVAGNPNGYETIDEWTDAIAISPIPQGVNVVMPDGLIITKTEVVDMNGIVQASVGGTYQEANVFNYGTPGTVWIRWDTNQGLLVRGVKL